MTAAAPASGLTTVQRAVLNALTESMTGVVVDVAEVEPLGAEAFAEALRFRNEAFRTRMVQAMLLAEMLLVPIPADVTARVESYATWLGVGDDMMRVVRANAADAVHIKPTTKGGLTTARRIAAVAEAAKDAAE